MDENLVRLIGRIADLERADPARPEHSEGKGHGWPAVNPGPASYPLAFGQNAEALRAALICVFKYTQISP